MVSKKKCSAKKRSAAKPTAESIGGSEAEPKSSAPTTATSAVAPRSEKNAMDKAETEMEKAATVMKQEADELQADSEDTSDSERSIKKIYWGCKPKEKIFAPLEFDEDPVLCQCPFCEEVIETRTRYVMGIAALLCCIFTCVISCIFTGGGGAAAGGAAKGAQAATKVGKLCKCCNKCMKCGKCCMKICKCCYKCCKCCLKCCKFVRRCLQCRCFKCCRVGQCGKCKRCKEGCCSDIEHFCPNCERVVGRKRIWRICNG